MTLDEFLKLNKEDREAIKQEYVDRMGDLARSYNTLIADLVDKNEQVGIIFLYESCFIPLIHAWNVMGLPDPSILHDGIEGKNRVIN